MRILCTGAEGFIGSHLIPELKDAGVKAERALFTNLSSARPHWEDR